MSGAGQVAEDEGVLDFGNPQIAFESMNTLQLFRSCIVFQTCAFGWVVRNCDRLYAMSMKVFGGRITHGILRYTLFNHFCAGETAEGIVPRINHLRSFGVGGILDYAAEAKDEELPKAEVPLDEATTVGAPLSARKYEYISEAMCDANAAIFMDAVRAVRNADPDGFAAIKLSGLGDPKLMERMSTCLVELTRFFLKISRDGDDTTALKLPYYCIDTSFKLDWETFSSGWRRFCRVEDEEALRRTFDLIDTDKDGLISFLEWAETVRLSDVNKLVGDCIRQGPLAQSALDENELELYFNLINRVQKIMDLAKELGVRVMVDAEWVDIQPAIDHLVIFLQRKYNTGDRPIVFQTYQMYLKGMQQSIHVDLERSRREGWRFGAKVVRGAYMVSEREKARVRGVESPICETYEDSEANYHAAIEAILRHGSSPGNTEAEMLVASHNRGSIELTTRLMRELGKDKGCVYFGQLLGMADHLTFTLAKHGYKAYKYVPYGPISEVVPYLIRRTQENSAILGSPGVQEERRMIRNELVRRLQPF